MCVVCCVGIRGCRGWKVDVRAGQEVSNTVTTGCTMPVIHHRIKEALVLTGKYKQRNLAQ